MAEVFQQSFWIAELNPLHSFSSVPGKHTQGEVQTMGQTREEYGANGFYLCHLNGIESHPCSIGRTVAGGRRDLHTA
jgi:hypothetical protein